MGGVVKEVGRGVSKLTGADKEAARRAEEMRAQQEAARAEREKLRLQKQDELRLAAEARAAKRRTRRGGLLQSANVISGDQTLGSGNNM